MNNVFDQAFALSQAITEYVLAENVISSPLVGQPGVDIFFTDPLKLLNSYGILHTNKAKLVIFDTPRASKRKPVRLYAANETGEVISKEISHDDPAYRFIHAANLLTYSRLLNQVLANDGVLLAVTTPEVYMNVRGAIEHYIGVDKYIGELVYQSRSGGGADSTWLSTDHETILIFSKDKSLISRFQLTKESDELEKYKLEDEISKYTWDTYIRKNARNYYKIKAPDGQILELDEHGNKIPWLWNKKTFEEKLGKGELKFEKNKEGRWRLYYKDRLKDVKILRSISLNSTLLSQISDEFNGAQTGGSLLNAKGSAEISSYTGDKPDYLKPSDYFYFLYSIFNRSGGLTIVPFNDYGSAAEGAEKFKKFKDKLVLNNEPQFSSLIKWRVAKLSGISSSTHYVSPVEYGLSDFFKNSNESMSLTLHLISATRGLTDEWSYVDISQACLHVNFQDGRLYCILEGDQVDSLKELASAVLALCDDQTHQINFYSKFDISLASSALSELEIKFKVNIQQIPQVFLK